MTERDYLLALHRVEFLGPVALAKLHERFGSYRSVWWAKEGELRALLQERQLTSLRDARTSVDPARIGLELDRAHITALTLLDETYPRLLRETHAAPSVLYLRGELPVGPTVSIVGTRTATAYGRAVTGELTRALVAHGVTVVSGLAYGIDIEAHRATLAAGGTTVAVFASPLGEIHPSAHRPVAEKIAQSGALITEYPPGIQTQKGLFPARNRLIAGLSPVTVVVEAGEKSGALITARLALAENRDVLAVPGPIHTPTSVGTNRLIQSGADLIQSPEDVLEALGIAGHAPAQPLAKAETEIEARVVVAVDGPTHFDTIAERSMLSAAELGSLLTQMEVSGKIRHLGAGIYTR